MENTRMRHRIRCTGSGNNKKWDFTINRKQGQGLDNIQGGELDQAFLGITKVMWKCVSTSVTLSTQLALHHLLDLLLLRNSPRVENGNNIQSIICVYTINHLFLTNKILE